MIITAETHNLIGDQKNVFNDIDRIFRKRCNTFNVQYIPNFIGYKSICYINEGLLSW
jgi:hypothetical protein